MTEHMTIHIASEHDLSVILEMAQIVFRNTYASILSAEQMEYMMEWMYSMSSLSRQLQDGHVFHIAEKDGVPCGYMSVGKDGYDSEGTPVYHLHKLYIMPSFQGRGVGKALLDAAKEHVRKDNASSPARLELNVNRYNPAVGFYLHEGLSILRQGDFHIGNGFYMNDYIMGTDV